MRSMWKGSLGFGMVAIPVKMYKAVESKSIGFNQLHSECNTRIQMPKYCPTCDRHVEASEIIKAYPLDAKAGQYVPVTKEELESLPLSSLKNIQVEAFVKSIDDVRWFDTAYVLAPEEVGTRAFVLFAKAMEELKVIGLAKIAVRDKESLCAIRPQDGILLLQTMHWGDELRDYGELIPFADVSEKEMDMAKTLLTSMTQEVDLHSYKDAYRDALIKLIEAKLAGKTIEAPTPEKKAEGDLIDQLMASLKPKEAVDA
jgi:DNA end-binding protein Ku